VIRWLSRFFKREQTMNFFASLAAISVLVAAIASPLFAADEPPTKDDLQAKNASSANLKPPFSISKDTTYVTEPLAEDGYVNCVTALNAICSKGAAPENNAVVLLLEAVGPEGIWKDGRARCFSMLGIEPLPVKGDYLISFYD
jgi:hypothetical protein